MSETPDAAHRSVVEGAGGVVFNREGNVLLIRHQKGEWVFPKGHIEDDEDPLATARREVAEEAGVETLHPASPSGRWITQYTNARGQFRQITWFELETDAVETVMREAQFPEGAFVPPDEAMRRLSFSQDRELLQKVLARR